MATPEYINYMEDYRKLKPSLFRESENLDKIFSAIHTSTNMQQFLLLELAQNILSYKKASGYHLDYIGSLVGQERFLADFNTDTYFGFENSYQSETFGTSSDPSVGGFWNSRSYFNTASARRLTDEEFKRLIEARVIFNSSDCSTNDLIEVINLITGRKDNTVQTLRHGLVRITTKDDTGLLSYFVDRIDSVENILPVAAGVRVELNSAGGGSSGGGGDPETLADEWVHDGYIYDYTQQAVGLEDGRLNLISDILIDGEYGGAFHGTAKTQMLDFVVANPEYKDVLLPEIIGGGLGVGGVATALYSKTQYGVQGTCIKGALYIAFGSGFVEGQPIVFRGLTERTAHNLANMSYANYYADPLTNKIGFQELPQPVEIRLSPPSEESIAFVEAMHNSNSERPRFNRQSVVSHGVAINHGQDIVVNATLRACVPQSVVTEKLQPEFPSADFSEYTNPNTEFTVDYIP